MLCAAVVDEECLMKAIIDVSVLKITSRESVNAMPERSLSMLRFSFRCAF